MLHHFLSVPGPPACERAAPPAAGWWWRPAPSGCGSVSPRCPAAAAGRSSRRRTPAPAPEPSHAPAPPDSDTHTDTAMRRQRDSEGGREETGDLMCSYGDGLLVVGQDAALPLQVSLLLPEQQLKTTSLLLFLLHAAELLVHSSLQVGQKSVSNDLH